MPWRYYYDSSSYHYQDNNHNEEAYDHEEAPAYSRYKKHPYNSTQASLKL